MSKITNDRLTFLTSSGTGSFIDWIGLSSVLRRRQHSIGYMGDGFYRSKDPTNSIKVLKEHIVHRQIKHTISRCFIAVLVWQQWAS